MKDGPVVELVIVVDEADQPVGLATRAEVRAGNLGHRAVAVVVIRGDGAVLVHRRSDAKALWPGLWDVAAGGAVDEGETYEHAAARELAEEVGIGPVRLDPIGPGRFVNDQVNEHVRMFIVRWNGPVRPDPAEVAEVAWVAPGDVAAWLRATMLAPDSAALLASRLADLAKPVASEKL